LSFDFISDQFFEELGHADPAPFGGGLQFRLVGFGKPKVNPSLVWVSLIRHGVDTVVADQC
jgi:hypothetical protein